MEVPLTVPAPPSISKPARSPSPIPEGGVGDSLSIQETNKLRAKLGLKPLETDTGPINQPGSSKGEKSGLTRREGDPTDLNQYKDDFGEFFHKPAGNIAEKNKADKIRNKLKERKEKRALDAKLAQIRGLGDSEDEKEENATDWIKKSRNKEREKQEAAQRAKMLEEMDQEFGVGALVEQETRNTKRAAYKNRDLKGLRVEHDAEAFTEGKQVILTLKDKEVLAEDDDTLINVNMIDDERYKKNVENTKLNPNLYGYNVYADETIDENGQIASRPLLGKYDEEIDGGKKKSFTLGENADEERVRQRKLLEIKSKLNHKRLESLDGPGLTLASEYYTEQEMTAFKKTKKKKVRKIRQKLKADDLLPLAGDVPDSKDVGSRRRAREDIMNSDDVPAFNDQYSGVKFEEEEDDDLEQVLAKARRLKQKEALITKPFIMSTDPVKSEIKTENDSGDDEPYGVLTKDGNIMLNATAEFCRTLGDIPTYGKAGNRDEENDLMDFDEEAEELEDLTEEPASKFGTWSSVNPDAIEETSNHSIDISDVAILDEEPDLGSGVAGALHLAMSKGYLEKEENNRPSNSRFAHLQAKNYAIEDKTHGEDDKFGRRERYHNGPTVEFREHETFKPNVKLEYIDDSGRLLNAKEAFRYLSHKFHGKGPGKNKIEKRLQKMEQEVVSFKKFRSKKKTFY